MTCSGNTYINRGVVGFGELPASTKDSFGDTIGGIGSGIAPDLSSFSVLANGSVQGTIFAVPDRGWNTLYTIPYQNRIHKFTLTFTPRYDNCSQSFNAYLNYESTMLLSGSQGPSSLTSGLEASAIIPAANGFPDLPGAPFNGVNVSALDTEGIVMLSDGTFWISDEYGPYAYHFSSTGTMLGAIRPPNAFIPLRNGTENFASDNPPANTPAVNPAEPTSGRENNHGFEGIAISPDETKLTLLLQAGLLQDGGGGATTEYTTRILTYDISTTEYDLVDEYIVSLPRTLNPTKNTKKARSDDASELHYLSASQFLILSRDSGNGNGAASDTPSVYRQIDIIDVATATNFATNATVNSYTGAVAPGGTPPASLAAEEATYCSFINFNNNTDLSRFGVHNGAPGGTSELDEKWESIAVVPVPASLEFAGANEYFVISMSDNDFITANGVYGCANEDCTSYSDPTAQQYGDNPTQVMIFQANLPNYNGLN